jgi:hypothetical protein
MKAFWGNKNDARYVIDFPDDFLCDHRHGIVIPHLGACTEDAEDAVVRHWERSENTNSVCVDRHKHKLWCSEPVS